MVKSKNISDVRNLSKNQPDKGFIGGSANKINDDLISTKELSDLTGATFRQLDYWCRQGIISPVNTKNNPGSGTHRLFSRDLVDKVRLITKVSKAFSRMNSPLKRVIDSYQDGYIDLGDGITLGWDWVEHERGE